MNYNKIYSDLIESRRYRKHKNELDFYTEIHHIIPKCLGGDNSKTNLVILSAREHFIAHRLLVKIYPDNMSLKRALWLMWYYSDGLRCSSRTVSKIREQNSTACRGPNNGMYGKPSAMRGRITSEETKLKQSKAHKGKIIPPATRENMSKARIGRFAKENHPLFGVPSKLRSSAWDYFDELYKLWDYNNRPGRMKFEKIAEAEGFPKVSYRQMIEKFKGINDGPL